MKWVERLFPWAILLVFGGWVLGKAVPPRSEPGAVDFYALGQLPIRDGGRIMPLDTLARTTLQSISGRSEVQNEDGKTIATAVQWLTQVLDQPDWETGPAASYKIFRVEHDQLLATLELPRRPGFYRYSIEEIKRNFNKLQDEFDKIEKKRIEGKPLDLYDAKIEDLGKKLTQFQRLNRAGKPLLPVPPQSESEEWADLRAIDEMALQGLTDDEFKKLKERAVTRLRDDLIRQYGAVENIPQSVASELSARMRAYTNKELMAEARTRRESVSPAAASFTRLLRAARDDRGETFAAALTEYKDKYLAHVDPEVKSNAALEAWAMGHLSPFYYCAFLYVVVGVLSALGWLFWHGPLNRAALILGIFTLGFHTAALLTRMYVQGRPPVTNLYSSAVFIGWGAVALSLVLEAVYKNGIGNALAGVAGAATMQIAHFLGGSGDTMGMLVAVLDTNFWLATHVTTVTLGYTATFIAGMIGTVYLLRGIFTPSLDPAAAKSLTQMMYGVICFATLLSFVGTVLGGIWADYSWGRFWGWDPKENGAVMIVIWNALVLHARWGGIVKSRGMAILAVFGNVITAWSWFGTNQLQIGLHSYGFDNRLAAGCRWFWLSQLAVMAIGALPPRFWRSYRVLQGSTPVASVPQSNEPLNRKRPFKA